MEEKKRAEYVGWKDYFMAVAFLSAKRSKDPQYDTFFTAIY